MNRLREIEALASRYIDGLATPADVERLELLAMADPSLLRHFVALLNVDAGIAGIAAAWPFVPFSHEGEVSREVHAASGFVRSWVVRGLGAAGVLLTIAYGLYAVLGGGGFDQRLGVGAPGAGLADATAVASGPIAMLDAAVDAVWSDPNIDHVLRRGLLPRGPLRLVSGEVEMLFASGGVAVVNGPAVFEPIAADALRLTSGAVRCRCPRPGTELRVETPTGTVIDLGTEFAVSVGADAAMRVAVIEGSVQLDLEKSSKRMQQGESVVVDASGQMSDDVGFLKEVARQTALARFDREVAAAGVNLLADPSFEAAELDGDGVPAGAEPAGCSLGVFRIGPWLGSRGYAESVASPAATGGRAVRIASNGNLFWPLVLQHVPTGDISGRTVLAGVKIAQTSSDPLTDRQCAIVKLVFVDQAGREFAKAERHFLRAGSQADRFIETGIAAVAPDGTVAVRHQVLINACGLPTGSIVADDAALVVVDSDGD
jgi:hypothetical protein